MSSDIAIDDILRLLAFILGALLLISGLIDLGSLGGIDVFGAFSSGATAILKIIFGVFLMIAGLNPDAVRMVVEVFVRR